MKRKIRLTAVAFLAAVASIASADLVQGISIDFVTIGNPGNPGDTRTGADENGNPLANPRGCGSVDYIYQIGKYEVTNAQWYDFVAAVGSAGDSGPYYDKPSYWTGDNMPVTNVSWQEAKRFCNYLTSGNKNWGAYQYGFDRNSAVEKYGIVYVLPTQDEWYKAAYYTGSGYSTYANGTDVAPIAGDDTNYDQHSPEDSPWDVGTGAMEQNGTYDMMGNVSEWNETLISGSNPGLRGGTYNGYSDALRSSVRSLISAPNGFPTIGFRVASIPEPGTFLLLGLGGLMLGKRN